MLDERKVTIYPSLSDHLPKIPERTILYPLEPIGIGTPYCESLISYLYRLAYAHAISLDDLGSMLIQSYLGKHRKHLYYNSEATSYLVSQLEALTQLKNLEPLTLLKWSKVIHLQGVYHFTIRWCPYCLSEWQHSKRTLYIPILWVLHLVVSCPRHGNKLFFQCQNCDYQIKFIQTKLVIGYCPNCNSWLGETKNLSKEKSLFCFSDFENQVWQNYVTSNLCQLITLQSNNNSCKNVNALSSILREFLNFHSMTSGKLLKLTSFSTITGIKNSSLHSYLASQQNPLIKRFLQISLYFNVSLFQLLTEDLNTLIPKLNYY